MTVALVGVGIAIVALSFLWVVEEAREREQAADTIVTAVGALVIVWVVLAIAAVVS